MRLASIGNRRGQFCRIVRTTAMSSPSPERRDFLKFLVLISAAFALGQLWIGIQNWYRRRTEQEKTP